MPQPGGGAGANPYMPYPASGGSNFPPYPTSNFGGYPGYPGGASASAGPTGTGGGYPPYMPKSDGYPPSSGSGYNSFYNVCIFCCSTVQKMKMTRNFLNFIAKSPVKWHRNNNRRTY